MNLVEFKQFDGSWVMLDKDSVSLIAPHNSGEGTQVVLGGDGRGRELHLRENYATVRDEITLPLADSALRYMLLSDFDDELTAAKRHAALLRSNQNVDVHIVRERTGYRVEVRDQLSSRAGEDSRTLAELTEGGEGVIIRMIDDLVAVVADRG